MQRVGRGPAAHPPEPLTDLIGFDPIHPRGGGMIPRDAPSLISNLLNAMTRSVQALPHNHRGNALHFTIGGPTNHPLPPGVFPPAIDATIRRNYGIPPDSTLRSTRDDPSQAVSFVPMDRGSQDHVP